MLERYNIENISRAIRNPRLFLEEVRRIIRTAFDILCAPIFLMRYGRGIDVMNRKWDNLIILDACRYDYFERRNPLKGNLHRVISRGSSSYEFMKGNFVGRSFHDTVYVTANPHTPKLPDETFYTVVPVYDQWDEKLETVPPNEVTAAAIEAHEKYPDKRLIVHYMQPHSPHLGTTAERIKSRLDIKGWDRDLGVDGESAERMGTSTWPAVRNEQISHKELRQAYAESIDIVMSQVKTLLQNVDGQSIITADHGEFLGERHPTRLGRRYGHPTAVYARAVREVPWFVVNASDSRSVQAADPIGYDRIDEQTVHSRLKALGYK